MAAIISTAITARIGRGVFERTGIPRELTLEKPLKSSGFSRFRGCGRSLENMRRIACHIRIALLNDRPRKALTAFRAHSSVGRAADS